MTGTYSDISLRKIAEGRLRLLAEFDSLTGLPNRALFHDRLEHALIWHARSRNGCALLFLDIDHLKLVNDTHGHETGDMLLVEFGKALRECVRASDTVCRLPGDEFTIILKGLRSVDDATKICESILDRTSRTLTANKTELRVSTSIGIAFLSVDELDAAAVLRRADAALYQSKNAGRNRYSVGH